MRTPPLILAVLLAATACSSGETGAPSTSSTPTTTSAAAGAGRCVVVAKQYEKVTDALIDKGCTDENGTLRLGKHQVCKNGQRLWEMNDLIGLSGEEMVNREKKSPEGITAWMLFDRACAG